MELKVKILKENAKLPVYATEGSAGMDLFAHEGCTLWAGEKKLIGTGIAVQVPAHFELQIRPRSGLALRKTLLVHFGTLDSDYRGEVGIILYNYGDEEIIIAAGEAIAQGVLNNVPQASFKVVEQLDPTARGEGGFGSTDKKVQG